MGFSLINISFIKILSLIMRYKSDGPSHFLNQKFKKTLSPSHFSAPSLWEIIKESV